MYYHELHPDAQRILKKLAPAGFSFDNFEFTEFQIIKNEPIHKWKLNTFTMTRPEEAGYTIEFSFKLQTHFRKDVRDCRGKLLDVKTIIIDKNIQSWKLWQSFISNGKFIFEINQDLGPNIEDNLFLYFNLKFIMPDEFILGA